MASTASTLPRARSGCPPLDLSADVTSLTAAVCDIESVSQDEAALADAIEAALRPLAHLEVTRDGNTVVARTSLGRAERVVLAGHIDTVPLTVACPTCRPAATSGDACGAAAPST